MSYSTLKAVLTGNEDSKNDFNLALVETLKERDRLRALKQGIIDIIFIPTIDIMSEYIVARQQYLNDNDITYLDQNANYSGVAQEWRSPISHEYNETLAEDYAYGGYSHWTGSIDNWKIEKWNLYEVDPGNAENNTFTMKICAHDTGGRESYLDINHTRLSQVTAAPYSLDITRHSLTNLTHAATSFDVGMKWIWATTSTRSNDDGTVTVSTNPYAGIYNSWGINNTLDGLETSIASIETQIAFKTELESLNGAF
jgi:hypothetical protein